VADLADPLEYAEQWRVRSYELDSNGHVNNTVYVGWIEEIATRHAEAAGYGREWTRARGGAWVIHRNDITYHRPAVYGDEVEVRVQVESIRYARGVRRTWITRVADQELLCEALTEWAWINPVTGRPGRAPQELVDLVAAASD
jgi:acyl-CoA thioester hydrolase